MQRVLRSALAALVSLALLAIAPTPTRASQGSCIMPTVGTVSGLTLVNDINACNQSLLSLYSGPTAPSGPTAYMLWLNTTTNYVQQYDGTSWLNLWHVDASNHLAALQIGGGVPSTTLAAGSTVDLGSVPQPSIIVSGSATINSFGASAPSGSIHNITFSGNSTLVHNPSLISLPGLKNINTQTGDTLTAISGGGAWRVLHFTPANASSMVAAWSLLGNLSGSPTTSRSDVNPSTVAQKGTPTGADKIPIFDSAAADAIRWVSASSLAAITGVTSIDGATGAFATGGCVTSTSNTLQLTPACLTRPTATVLTSGTNLTYTFPANVRWVEILAVGGGGGGGGGNNTTPGATGGQTCLASSGAACGGAVFLFANGGSGGSYTNVGAGGGTGGGYDSTQGNSGSPGSTPGLNHNGVGGTGGGSCAGGGAPGSVGNATGSAAQANSGAGGGGGGNTNGTLDGGGGSGGAAGGCARQILSSPGASFVYTIGAGGAGAAGASINSSAGGAGGLGATGKIVVIEHYGSWLIVFVGFRLRRRRPAANDNSMRRVAA